MSPVRTEMSYPDLNPEKERYLFQKNIFWGQPDWICNYKASYTLRSIIWGNVLILIQCLQRQMFYISFDLELRSLNGKVLVFGSFFEMHSFQEGWKMKELNSSLLSPLSLLLAMLTVTPFLKPELRQVSPHHQVSTVYQRTLWETCHPWDMWSGWWGETAVW